MRLSKILGSYCSFWIKIVNLLESPLVGDVRFGGDSEGQNKWAAPRRSYADVVAE